MTAEGSIRSPDVPRWFGPPFVPPFVPSVARGVGSRETVSGRSRSEGGRGRPFRVRPCVAPLPLPSVAFGVGSSVSRSDFPPVRPVFGWAPVVSDTVGVGNKEPPLPAVRGSDVGRSDTAPVRIEPERGKVGKDNIEPRSSSNDGCHVLQHDESRSNHTEGGGDDVPESTAGPFHDSFGRTAGRTGEVSRVEFRDGLRLVGTLEARGDEPGRRCGLAGGRVVVAPVAVTAEHSPGGDDNVAADPGAAAGVTDVLAGEPGGEDVDRRDGGPVHGRDVSEVGDVRPVVGEDRGGAGVGVGDPGQFHVQHGGDGHAEAFVAGAEGAEAEGRGHVAAWQVWQVPSGSSAVPHASHAGAVVCGAGWLRRHVLLAGRSGAVTA